jgi:hypothetical protein
MRRRWMRISLVIVPMLAVLAAAACSDSNQVALNKDCRHDCFTLDNIENVDEAMIQGTLQAMCEGKGAPKINQRRKTVIAAQCGD